MPKGMRKRLLTRLALSLWHWEASPRHRSFCETAGIPAPTRSPVICCSKSVPKVLSFRFSLTVQYRIFSTWVHHVYAGIPSSCALGRKCANSAGRPLFSPAIFKLMLLQSFSYRSTRGRLKSYFCRRLYRTKEVQNRVNLNVKIRFATTALSNLA